MTGEKLHKFDLDLCNYVLDNLGQYLARPWSCKKFKEQLGPCDLLDHLIARTDPHAEIEPRQIDDPEFDSLISALEELPSHRWEPYPELHKRFSKTILEVRKTLTMPVAEIWADACARFSGELEVKGLEVATGVSVAHAWTRHLRKLLTEMEATAFLPESRGIEDLSDKIRDGIKVVRRMFKADPKQRTAKSTVLVKKLEMQRQVAYQVLGWLSDRGEYRGFDPQRKRRAAADPTRSPSPRRSSSSKKSK